VTLVPVSARVRDPDALRVTASEQSRLQLEGDAESVPGRAGPGARRGAAARPNPPRALAWPTTAPGLAGAAGPVRAGPGRPGLRRRGASAAPKGNARGGVGPRPLAGRPQGRGRGCRACPRPSPAPVYTGQPVGGQPETAARGPWPARLGARAARRRRGLAGSGPDAPASGRGDAGPGGGLGRWQTGPWQLHPRDPDPATRIRVRRTPRPGSRARAWIRPVGLTWRGACELEVPASAARPLPPSLQPPPPSLFRLFLSLARSLGPPQVPSAPVTLLTTRGDAAQAPRQAGPRLAAGGAGPGRA
jgi:hypothetical protein